jgi:hypothetical protein
MDTGRAMIHGQWCRVAVNRKKGQGLAAAAENHRLNAGAPNTPTPMLNTPSIAIQQMPLPPLPQSVGNDA